MKAIATLLLILPLAACGGGGATVSGSGNPAGVPLTRLDQNSPAAGYCAELGGQMLVRQEQAGEAGYCSLPDGSVVEEWQLYKGRDTI